MGFDLGRAWGSVAAGTEKALEGAFGVRPDGFYNNRFNPTTEKLEGVRPDGTAFTISPEEMTQGQRDMLGAAIRKKEKGELRQDLDRREQAQLQQTLAVTRATSAPQLAAIQQNGVIALQTLKQQGANAEADRAAARELNEKNWQLRAQELGLTDKNQQLLYAQRQQELADARSQFADTLAMRKEQLALDRKDKDTDQVMAFLDMIARGAQDVASRSH
jgi:flagellum-specific peptidoglycan hydrolase FlgJ